MSASRARLRRHLVSTSLFAVLALWVVATRTTTATETNIIRTDAGQTVEIGTDTLPQHPAFSWVLTRDRKFQGAQRTRFFQARLPQVGTYILDVSVQDAQASQNDYRAFTILVTEPQAGGITAPPPLLPDDAPPQAVLTTDPVPINGSVYIPLDGGIVKIDPSKSVGKITSYALDLDTTSDADGDGNPANDRDTQETFSEKDGTPIYYYFLPRSTPRAVALTVTNINTSQSVTTAMNIAFGEPPVSSSAIASNPNSPVAMEVSDLTARFIPRQFGQSGAELLFEWDFGDRSKSLLTAPTHTYATAGTYTVGLLIRNIRTGEIVYSGTDTVSVEAGATGSSSSTSLLSSSASSAAEPSSSSSASSAASTVPQQGTRTFSIVKVGFIIVLLLVLAGVLYGLLTWLKRKATGKIGATFEKMEQTLLKPDAKTAVETGKAAPLKLRKESSPTPVAEKKAAPPQELADNETARREFRSQDRTLETPPQSAGPVPSWLQKAASGSPSPAPSRPTTAPTQTAAPTSVTPPQAPKPPPPPSAQSGPVPSWLQKASTATPAQAPQSTTTPVPPPTSTPTPVSPPPPPPGSATPTPSWLKPKLPDAGGTVSATPAPVTPAVTSTPARAPQKPGPTESPVAPPQTAKAVTPIVPPPVSKAAPAPAVSAPPPPPPTTQNKPPSTPEKKPASAPPPAPPKPTPAPSTPPPPPAPAATPPPVPAAPRPQTATVKPAPKSAPGAPLKPSPAQAAEAKTIAKPTPPTPATPPASESKSIPATPPNTPPPTNIPAATQPSRPTKQDSKDDGPPIAIIQADSLSK